MSAAAARSAQASAGKASADAAIADAASADEAGAPRSWLEGNARFLAAALAALRLRLQAQGGAEVPEAALRQADRDAADAASNMQPGPALALLGERFGLSRLEERLLLLCAGMELDPQIPGLCARAHADGLPHPTFGLALALSGDEAAWDVVSPERPLRRWRLLEVHGQPLQPLISSPLRGDERIVNAIKGLDHLDQRLLAVLSPPPPDDAMPLAASQLAAAERIAEAVRLADVQGLPCPLMLLLGSDAASKQLVAARLAAAQGRRLLSLRPARLALQPEQTPEALARLWQRECRLAPMALYVERSGVAAAADPAAAQALARFLEPLDGLVFVDVHELRADLGRSRFAVEIGKPTSPEQRQAWQQRLGPEAGQAPAALAAQFNLDASTIDRIAAGSASPARPADAGEPNRSLAAELAEAAAPAGDGLETSLWDACRQAVRPNLEALARRIECRATWDEIVLPDDQRTLLRQICAQVRSRGRVYDDWGYAARMNRGLGISALFSGASGVGKTMGAEVVANDLRLDLYLIDLSSVVSKFIGETEDNLRRVFDAAEDGGAILFFDECDALFGKRSEVKDSHDRYANIQINYLLQRIEAYRGLAILATNAKSALDTAFVRRLRFVIDFPFPSPQERQAIWRKAFPAAVPCDRLDFERLGRLNLSGGNIHNAALGAAFLAAEAGTPVGMPCVLAATRSEFLKLGRPHDAADLQLAAGRVGGRVTAVVG